MNCQLIRGTEIKLVGIEKRIEITGNKLQDLWAEFTKREKEIKNRVSDDYYGVASKMKKVKKSIIFDEMIALEVSEFNEIPLGMSTKTLPPQEYLVFTHKGKLFSESGESLINKTYENLFNFILTYSDYKVTSDYNFELYDERFIYDSPDSELDIYIPVVEKNTFNENLERIVAYRKANGYYD